MDQMAIDTTGVSVKWNQSILLKKDFRRVSLMVWRAISSSSCFELQFPSMPMNSIEYITVPSCSWLSFLKKLWEKNMFSNRTMSEFMAADWVWNGFVTNLLRFYFDQLAFLTWILLKMLREFLSEEYIQITDNLPVLKISNYK